MPAPNEITVPQLLRLIGTPDCPAIVDVTMDDDFDADPFLIPGAIRHSYDDADGLAKSLNDRACIVVCQKGRKLSQGVAAILRSRGIKAEYLSGGNYGWRDQNDRPRVPVTAIPEKIGGRTLWVTRHRPKIDRIACPWLIRRFVDPSAEFLFVAPSEIPGVAEHFGATPFDVEDAFWTHRGDRCTFDLMLDEFGLRTKALDHLSDVVRAADTNQNETCAEAAGLLAISVGLSRQYKDDLVQLEAGMAIYDALYRWARDGQGETHDWPGTGA